jgi:enterochelin esterase family protein
MRRSGWLSTILAVPLALVVLMSAGPVALAQQRPEAIASPEIGADHSVTFRIKAPKASEVVVSASVGTLSSKPEGTTKDAPDQWSMPMQKGPDGIWTLTIGPLEPEIYRYVFLVDGMRALDLANPNINAGGSIPWSYFEIAGDPPRFDQVRDVPHGSVQFRTYRVSESKALHTVAIYVPPDYDRDPRRKFPVLYLFHGGGDAQEGWTRLGHVAAIEENLLAEHKTKPMLVVMPYGDIPGDATALDAIEAFGRELFGDVMPMVEKDYRVEANRDGRAVAGLSMGAGQAFTLGLRNLDRFAWVAEFSAGAFGSPKFDLDTQVPGLLHDPAAVNQKLKLLFLGCGTEDTRYPPHLKLGALLDRSGIKYEFHSTPGEHEWKVWRHLLAELMPKLFVSGS